MKRIFLIILFCAISASTVISQSTRRKGIKAAKSAPLPVSVSTTNDTIKDIETIEATVSLTDFKKTVASRVESVMITNLSPTDTIVSLEVDIDYRTPEGKQLHRRAVVFDTKVPPHESRFASVQSWDRQQLFYHTDTPPVRKTHRTSPFTVTITPLTLILATP